MTTVRSSPSAVRHRLLAAGLTAAWGGLVYESMPWLRQLWLTASYGPICGHGAGEVHCAACYVALAAALLAAAWLTAPVAAARLRPRLRVARTN